MELMWSQFVFMELKKIIKDRGLNYKQVAQSIGLSESGFKKLMAQFDCSLQKLEMICSSLGIKISDLINAAENRELHEIYFTKQEQDLFTKNREAFQVYWFLVYERRTDIETMQIMGIDRRKFFSIVRKLDQVSLVKQLPKDRIQVPTPIGVRWMGHTPFLSELYRKWSQLLLNNVISLFSKGTQDQYYFAIRYLKMSESTWKRLRLELEKLEVEYSNIAAAEMRFDATDLKHVRWITAIDHKSWGEDDLK